jgi:hypothetical protein
MTVATDVIQLCVALQKREDHGPEKAESGEPATMKTRFTKRAQEWLGLFRRPAKRPALKELLLSEYTRFDFKPPHRGRAKRRVFRGKDDQSI